jgi:hypothetical protein
MHGKTIAEMREITFEAERRVRAGEPQANVASALGIPASTLATWAQRGGWRRKDLIAVRNVARGEMVLGLIENLTAVEREKSQAKAVKLREALEVSKAEFEATAPDGRLAGAFGEGPVPAQKLAMAMADSLLRQGQLEEADRAVRLAARFAEAEQAAGAREEAKLREERERLTKWWAEKQTAYHKLHTAVDFALEQIAASQQLEDSRSADDCCPKCGRRMDFWPEEVERPEDVESDESAAGEPAVEFGDEFAAPESVEDDFRLLPSGASESPADPVGGSHPNWKKDANGGSYWDEPAEDNGPHEAVCSSRRAAFGIGGSSG